MEEYQEKQVCTFKEKSCKIIKEMERKMQIETNEFSTKDMALAACLMVEGIRYLRAERDEGRRLTFVFDSSMKVDDIARIQSERANATHVVSSVHYDDKLRALKTIIHSA